MRAAPSLPLSIGFSGQPLRGLLVVRTCCRPRPGDVMLAYAKVNNKDLIQSRVSLMYRMSWQCAPSSGCVSEVTCRGSRHRRHRRWRGGTAAGCLLMTRLRAALLRGPIRVQQLRRPCPALTGLGCSRCGRLPPRAGLQVPPLRRRGQSRARTARPARPRGLSRGCV